MPPKTTTTKTKATVPALMGSYRVTDTATLIAEFSDGRSVEVSLRMSLRKLREFAAKAQALDGATQGDVFAALESLDDLLPAGLADNEDLDYTEALEVFQQWSQQLGERMGKALT